MGMSTSDGRISRRDFLSTATAAAAALIVGLNLDIERAEAVSQRSFRRRLGISDEAFEAASVRARVLASKMTLTEKISQVGDNALAVPHLNIPAYNYYSSEALHGLCAASQVTSFPVPLALAASWNPELARQVYTVVSDECRGHDNSEHGGLSYYSPATLNLHRDPRWGRCYEAPGEDPCLAATMAIEIIRGMQGDDPRYLKTTACSKHFICNNTEDDREATSATVDDRSFWEFYTRAYRATILYADVFTFMSAYSAINGVPCSASHLLLTDILRDQWGFRGYVTSDCDAVKDIFDPHHYAPDLPTAAAEGIKAGCDLNCWGGAYAHLQEAVDRGLVTEDQIGQAVTRLLTVRILLGTLDPPSTVPYSSITLDGLPWEKHHALAVESARQSLVLLKNEDGFLPLNPTKVKKIAVVGPLAAICHLGGYSGSPSRQITPLKGIAERLGVPVRLNYIVGGDYSELHGSVRTQGSPLGTLQLAYIQDGDWARFDGIDFTGKTEMRVNVESASNGGTVEVRLDKIDGPVIASFAVTNTGDWDHIKEISAPLSGVTGVHNVYTLFHGSGGNYLLNLERMTLYPITPIRMTQNGIELAYAAGCSVSGARDDASFHEAIDAARGADAVIMVCGVNGDVDGEGHDRNTIGLTGVQPDLIQAVQAVNPNIALVLSSNNSVSIEWEQANLPAILGAICAGQGQGTAIAEALFGDYNPGGKLPCTWYRSLEQLPPSHDYDIHKGRTYQYFDGDPLYPFGFGLSYTSFRIDHLKASTSTLAPGGIARFSVRVTNTGAREGAEVVQLYIVPPSSKVKRAHRQLAGFQRVVLGAGERKTVTFEVPYHAQPFWYWSDTAKRFTVEPGTATVEIGNSSANAQLKASVALTRNTTPLTRPDDVETIAVKSFVA